MRFSLAVALLLLGISVSGVAEQKFKVKHTPSEKPVRVNSAPVGKPIAGGNPATASPSKELQALERQTAKSSVPRATAKKRSGVASVKPIKDKPNPPINLREGGNAHGSGLNHQSPNPYKARLKQKYGRQ